MHTGDLHAATDAVEAAPVSVTTATLRVLGLLVAEADATRADALLRSLTGRDALPSGFSLL